jgi:NAD(P)-dependent dehydrogenase (short-subunit alcohol dehydrogenase family)
MPKVILITGVSSGIGKVCAEYLSGLGFKVYGTSRKTLDIDLPYTLLKMDVTDVESVKQATNFIIEKEGKIDILVNNAGMGIAGAIEDNTDEEVRIQFETNFFGTLNVCKSVIPFMREKGEGKIINLSSLGGIMGLPFQGIYSATKFAIEGFSEALRMELKHSGIKVVVINPGDFKTNFTQNRIITNYNNSIYKEQYLKTMSIVEHEEQNGSNPIIIAKTIARIIHKKSPKNSYYVGNLLQVMFAKSKRILPSKLFSSALGFFYKI